MTRRVYANEITDHLTADGHTDTTRQPAWTPGYRTHQASPYTVRLWHDGPDEQQHLDQYVQTLRTAGYTVTPERPAGKRPALRVTQP